MYEGKNWLVGAGVVAQRNEWEATYGEKGGMLLLWMYYSFAHCSNRIDRNPPPRDYCYIKKTHHPIQFMVEVSHVLFSAFTASPTTQFLTSKNPFYCNKFLTIHPVWFCFIFRAETIVKLQTTVNFLSLFPPNSAWIHLPGTGINEKVGDPWRIDRIPMKALPTTPWPSTFRKLHHLALARNPRIGVLLLLWLRIILFFALPYSHLINTQPIWFTPVSESMPFNANLCAGYRYRFTITRYGFTTWL